MVTGFGGKITYIKYLKKLNYHGKERLREQAPLYLYAFLLLVHNYVVHKLVYQFLVSFGEFLLNICDFCWFV